MVYFLLKCSKCGMIIREDKAGQERNKGKAHNYFWNAPQHCYGVLLVHEGK